MNPGTQVNQRVMIDQAAHEELTFAQLNRPYTIVKVKGEGDDAFVMLEDYAGRIVKWIRATDLLPARADLKPSERPHVFDKETP